MIFHESAYYTTNRESALGLMFAEFRGAPVRPPEYAPGDGGRVLSLNFEVRH